MIFRFAMPLPAFRGVAVLGSIEGLANPRGFVLADAYQRNLNFPNIFAIGVCVSIPRVGRTSAHRCTASRYRHARHGTRCAWRISAIGASPSRGRRSRRGMTKVEFEKYFPRKIRAGESEPFYERFLLSQLDVPRLKKLARDPSEQGGMHG